MSEEDKNSFEKSLEKLRKANEKLEESRKNFEKTNKKLKKLAENSKELARKFGKRRYFEEKIVEEVDFGEVSTEDIPSNLLALKRFREDKGGD